MKSVTSAIEKVRELKEAIHISGIMLKVYRERQQPGWLDEKLVPLNIELEKVTLNMTEVSQQAATAANDGQREQRKLVKMKKQLTLLDNRKHIEKLSQLAVKAKGIRKELADLGIEVK